MSLPEQRITVVRLVISRLMRSDKGQALIRIVLESWMTGRRVAAGQRLLKEATPAR
jgi:hypothetical protein